MGFLLNKIFSILKKTEKKKTMGGFPFVVYTFDIWIYDRSWKPRCWFEWKYLWIHIKVAPPSMASDRKFHCLCCCKQPVHVLCLKMVLEVMLCKFFWPAIDESRCLSLNQKDGDCIGQRLQRPFVVGHAHMVSKRAVRIHKEVHCLLFPVGQLKIWFFSEKIHFFS